MPAVPASAGPGPQTSLNVPFDGGRGRRGAHHSELVGRPCKNKGPGGGAVEPGNLPAEKPASSVAAMSRWFGAFSQTSSCNSCPVISIRPLAAASRETSRTTQQLEPATPHIHFRSTRPRGGSQLTSSQRDSNPAIRRRAGGPGPVRGSPSRVHASGAHPLRRDRLEPELLVILLMNQ